MNPISNKLRKFGAETAIILGSGAATITEKAEVIETLEYRNIPGIPASKVPGHAGHLVIAQLGSHRLLIASGRVHLYEGHTPADTTAMVRLLCGAGIRRLVLTNAAGAINPAFSPGDWMLIRDHINLTGASPVGGAQFVDMTDAYDSRLRATWKSAAANQGMTLHEGVYAAVRGPQYETPAEVRMLATLGADAVGMSTALETIQARALGIPVVGLACLANRAAGLGNDDLLDHTDVLQMANKAATDLQNVLENWLTTVPWK